MTTIRRILLAISLVIAGVGLWALTHGGRIGSYTVSRPFLITACVLAVIIVGLALATEVVMLLSNVQHPEPEDPPAPPPPVLYKPEPPTEVETHLKKTLDAADQAEEYLAQTRHRISVVIEDEDPGDSEPPKTPPPLA